jgi:hypothetical protein
VTTRKPRTTLSVRFEDESDLDAVHARARAAGYRSTEEYARRVLLGFEQPATHHHQQESTVPHVTDAEIRDIRNRAIESGDLRTEMITKLAQDPRALDGADDGSEADLLASEKWTQAKAREFCAGILMRRREAAVHVKE